MISESLKFKGNGECTMRRIVRSESTQKMTEGIPAF